MRFEAGPHLLRLRSTMSLSSVSPSLLLLLLLLSASGCTAAAPAQQRSHASRGVVESRLAASVHVDGADALYESAAALAITEFDHFAVARVRPLDGITCSDEPELRLLLASQGGADIARRRLENSLQSVRLASMSCRALLTGAVWAMAASEQRRAGVGAVGAVGAGVARSWERLPSRSSACVVARWGAGRHDWQRGRQCLRRALKLQPDEPDTTLSFAMVALKCGVCAQTV